MTALVELLLPLVLAIAYATRVGHLRRHGREPSVLRQLSFGGGLLLLLLAIGLTGHIPALYQAADEHDLLHLLEHASFLGADLVMWLALLGPFPKPEWFGHIAKVGYAAVIHFSSMGMANILMWSGTVLYPIYVESDRAHGISPLTDQSIAGAILSGGPRHAGGHGVRSPQYHKRATRRVA